MTQVFRPTAVPLIATDPYFSIWSFADRLTDDHPRHWTGRRQSMLGVLFVDGRPYRFLGKTEPFESYFTDGPALEQTSLEVTPTASVYSFSHPLCRLRVTFLTPLLADRPEVLSRPVSYIFYELEPLEPGHRFEVSVDFSADLCGDERGQRLVCRAEPGHVSMGAEEQTPLHCSGDDVRIDWGYLHLVHPGARLSSLRDRRNLFRKRISSRQQECDFSQPVPFRTMPLLCAVSDRLSDVFVVAYDDVQSVEYFGQPLKAYYHTVYGSFDAMLSAAVQEAGELRRVCAEFDRDLTVRMRRVCPAYAEVGALAYRQSLAAHKLVECNGELLFLSKENFSNGCIATLDITYPSAPLYLLLNPELVRGMLRPIFAYARTSAWEFPFAPHDCGTYPLCNGQVYGEKNGRLLPEMQMPVEECGNAILCVAAAVRADGNRAIAEENRDLLEKWADYLLEYGYDPENQLCTDDFAGHLAHNCNLSLKAIVALGAYGQLFDAPRYSHAAQEMAARWTAEARRSGRGWRLTFDRDDTWSLKYNIIWDRLLGLGLFAPEVSEEEVAVYTGQMRRYGVPLDSRADYTKLDWMAWTTVMTDNPAYTEAVYTAIRRMVCESPDRVPLTDWYDAVDGRQVGFQARSVVGGFYINLLAERFLHA